MQGWFSEDENKIQDTKQSLRENVFCLGHVEFEMLTGQVSVQVVQNTGLEFRREIWGRYTDSRAIHTKLVVDMMNKMS